MKYKLLSILLIFQSLTAFAGPKDTLGNYHLKAGGSLNQDSIFNSKIISLGYQHKLTNIFDYQLETGYFVDNTGQNAPKTLYAGPSIGTSINYTNQYLKVFFGGVAVSSTDQRLSSVLEFHTDFEMGLKDSRGVGLGVGYKHMSNAGISGSNLGRDFFYLKLQLP